MKLIKKMVGVFVLLFVVFAMTGCAELLGKLKDDIDQIPEADTPSFDYEEKDITVGLGAAVTLRITATVSDDGTLSYQWYKGSTNKRDDAEPIPLAIAPTYAYIASLKAEDDGKVEYYWCKVVNLKNGKTTTEWTDTFKVTIKEPEPGTPKIAREENYSFEVHYGDPVSLTVKASLEENDPLTYSLSYQWYKGSTNKREEAQLIDSTSDVTALLPAYAFLAPTAPEKDGVTTYYWCKVTNKNLKSGKTADAWSEAYSVTVSNIVRIRGHIDENRIWNKLYTYYVDSWLTIEKSLTIPAGTVVKIGKDCEINTTDEGTITAIGTKEAPITFTSYLDHSVGITIPEFEGSATKAAKGDWKGIRIAGAQGSTFTYANFHYSNEYALTLEKESTVSYCLFTDNKSNKYSGALTIEENGNESLVTNNTFYNNDWPLTCPKNYTVSTSNSFHKPDDLTIKNKYQAIILTGGYHIENAKNVKWYVTELPYYFVDGWFSVDNGTLSIGDATHNVTVKFTAGSYITVEEKGNLTLGVASILTSWKDDAHAGDMEANEQPVDPIWGDWEGISFYGSDYDNTINTDTTRVLYNNKENYQN